MTGDAMIQFERIQEFKRARTAVIDGVNYAHVIAILLYDRSWRALVKRVAFALLFACRVPRIEPGHASALLFYSYRDKGRSDYDYIVDGIDGLLGDESRLVEVQNAFSLLQVFRTLAQLPRARRASRGLAGGWMSRWVAALLIAKFVSETERLKGLLARHRVAVTFCDAVPYDNLIAQLAALEGVRTVTAQHGQYRCLSEANMSPDAEAYANFVSDQLLCWGAATQDEFRRAGVDPARLGIVGWLRRRPGRVDSFGPPGVFGVMLNGENGEESNSDLLAAADDLAAMLDLTYVVRVHPARDPDRYRKLVGPRCAEIAILRPDDYLARTSFSLAHMSGAVIELLLVGCPVYVLDDGRLAAAFIVDGLNFVAKDLIAAVEQDRRDPAVARERLLKLARWFNDDTDQDLRIQTAILGREELADA